MNFRVVFCLSLFSLFIVGSASAASPEESFWQALNAFDQTAHGAKSDQEVMSARSKLYKKLDRIPAGENLLISLEALSLDQLTLSHYEYSALEIYVCRASDQDPVSSLKILRELGSSRQLEDLDQAEMLATLWLSGAQTGDMVRRPRSAQLWVSELHRIITQTDSQLRGILIQLTSRIVKSFPHKELLDENQIDSLRKLAKESDDRHLAMLVGEFLILSLQDQDFQERAPALIFNGELGLGERLHYLNLLRSVEDERVFELTEGLIRDEKSSPRLKRACMGSFSADCIAYLTEEHRHLEQQFTLLGVKVPKALASKEDLKKLLLGQLEVNNDPRVILAAVETLGVLSLVEPGIRDEIERFQKRLQRSRLRDHTDLQDALDSAIEGGQIMDMLQQEMENAGHLKA